MTKPFYCFIALSSVLAFYAAAPSWAQGVKLAVPTKGFWLRKTISLWHDVHGVDGRLELLTDVRIKPDMDDAQTFDFAHAKIRVVTTNGISQEKTLERSRAALETSPLLYGKNKRPTYLLTVDYSADMGSYNGPITFLVEVVHGAMRFVPSGGKPISLMRSLKTDWKFAPNKSRATPSTDILEVACRPNVSHLNDADTNKNFTIYYRRYHWNGAEWIKRERSRLGWWEADGTFPKLALFPPAQP